MVSLVGVGGVPLVMAGALDMAALGRVVRGQRMARGWTVNALADRAGVAWHHVERLESGGSPKTSFGTVFRVALALDVTPDALLRAAGILDVDGVERELGEVVGQLTPAERQALVRIGAALVELRGARLGRNVQEGRDLIAAYDREDPGEDADLSDLP